MTVEKVLIQGLHISTRVTEPDAVLAQFAVPAEPSDAPSRLYDTLWSGCACRNGRRPLKVEL